MNIELPSRAAEPSHSSAIAQKPKVKKQGIFSYLHFIPSLRLARKANRLATQNSALSHQDMPDLSWNDRPDVLEEKIMHRLENKNKTGSSKKPSVVLAVLKTVKWTLALWILIHTAFFFLRILTAWAIKNLVEVCSDPSLPSSEAYKWCGILSGLLVLSFYSEHHYGILSYLLPTHIRSSLVSLIYSKVTRLSAYSLHQISMAKLMNLVAADLSIFELSANFSSNAVTSIFGLCGSTALLWIWFGPYCLVGIAFIVLSVPLQQLFISFTGKPKHDKTKITDQRIKLTSEIIEGIRLLKMYAWELRFKDMVEVIRKQELKLITKIVVWEGIERGLSLGGHTIAVTLFLLAYTLTGGELVMSNVFAAYFLFAILRLYTSFNLTIALNFLFDARIVMQRVQSVMDFPEEQETQLNEPQNPTNAVEFDNFTGYWASNKIDENGIPRDNSPLMNSEEKPTLSNINLNIKTGSLNALIGTVGAGKSSFLLSFTGEMPRTTGQLRKKGTIAFAEQEPTIFAGTFRENILFGKSYEPDFYNKVVKACNLENDLKMFPNGDLSEIGEKGNNLSGGQRARLGLARAVYADADIYLLDDPLSAVDAKVAKSLVNDAIKTMLKDKTVILVTHQVHFVKEFTNIIVLDGGHVLGNGTYAELREMNIDVDRIFNSTDDKDPQKKSTAAIQENVVSPTQPQGEVNPNEIQVQEKREPEKPKQNAEQDSYFTSEDPYAGKVDGKTYKTFLKELGGIPAILGLLATFVMSELSNIGFLKILGGWTSNDYTMVEGVSAMSGFAVFVNLLYVLRTVFASLLLLRVARKLQAKMLNTVVRNPVQFFDTNPLGRILARFTNDIGVLDSFLPLIALNTVDYASDIFALFFTLAISHPILIAPIASIILGAILMMRFSYQPIKQTKDCELACRDPVNNLFSASLSGMTIIKVFNQEDNFKKRFRGLLYNNTKVSAAFFNTSLFFGFYVDMIFNVGCIVSLFIVIARQTSPATTSLCVVLIFGVFGVLPFCLRQLIQLNVLMASVARVEAYCTIKSEAPVILSTDPEYEKQGWPKNGDIDFKKVYMKYRPDADYVIKNLNLHANPGEKIGCIGRTGAGKSSIIQLLFRLVEIDRNGEDKSDSHIKLDDVDIQNLGLHLLRNNISIIPQTPFIFTGTVKMNIDPTGKFSDEEIWNVLEDVNLRTHVEKLDRQLYFEIGGNSPAFSVGQKQLICLARTILNPSSLLVLDEATANMDQQTDMFIQNKIMEKFANSTVFTIAHRLSTIANYDKVLVLDKGRKVEFEAPYRLLVKEIGDDHITNENGHFGSMVMNTGPKASRHIFEVAKETYFRKYGIIGEMKEEDIQLK